MGKAGEEGDNGIAKIHCRSRDEVMRVITTLNGEPLMLGNETLTIVCSNDPDLENDAKNALRRGLGGAPAAPAQPR